MHLHAVVRGSVQGVGFRWFVRELASELHVAGWVMNRHDGSVEVMAEGADADIARLREALERGPAGAVVEQVDVLDDAEPFETNLGRFLIRR
jgi:acylphosphatase